MRRFVICLGIICGLAGALSAQAATGRVMKVLPQFIDLKGRTSLSPSLYDRDAYQVQLRQHPEQRSAMRFEVQWKSRSPVWEPLTLRLELRGVAQGNLPKQLALDLPVAPTGWFSRWDTIPLTGEQYKDLGEVTAWRVSLWEGAQLLGEQKSFLW